MKIFRLYLIFFVALCIFLAVFITKIQASDAPPGQLVKLTNSGQFLPISPPRFQYATGLTPVNIGYYNNLLYVVNNGSDSITKLTVDGEVLGTFKVGKKPYDLAFYRNLIFVTNFGGDTISCITLDGQKIGTYKAGKSPCGIIIGPDECLYITNLNDDTITKMTMDGEILGTFKTSSKPYDLVFDSSKCLYITCSGANKVLKMTMDGQILTPPGGETERFSYRTGKTPKHIILDPKGKTLFIANFGDGTITNMTFDGENLGTYKVGGQPFDLTFNPDDNLYITDYLNGNVIKMTDFGQILNSYHIGEKPRGIISGDAEALYIAIEKADYTKSTWAEPAKTPPPDEPEGKK